MEYDRFSSNGFALKGTMPKSVEYSLPGGCDEVYTYAITLVKAYQNLKYDIDRSKLCNTGEGGSTDSPSGVDMKEPNCGPPKKFEQATAESKFVKQFNDVFSKLVKYTSTIGDACSDYYGVAAKIIWAELEQYEGVLLNLRSEYKNLGFEITTKDALEDKPKGITEQVADTLSSILWIGFALIGGFFVVDYAYGRAPSKAIGERVSLSNRERGVKVSEAEMAAALKSAKQAADRSRYQEHLDLVEHEKKVAAAKKEADVAAKYTAKVG